MTFDPMHPSLVAAWNWEGADPLVSKGPIPRKLGVRGENPRIVGTERGKALELDVAADDVAARTMLFLSNAEAPELSLGGKDAKVTVCAWVKRRACAYAGCQFVAGVWNEHGRRQYGMFLNLKIHESSEQLGAHVSSHGGPTPGHPYCMDVAIGASPVPFEKWTFLAITYDGREAKSWVDGRLDVRSPEGLPGRNPFHYPGGLSESTADFSIGAVERPARVESDGKGGFTETGAVIANPFSGLLGPVAVFREALGEEEIRAAGGFQAAG